MRVAEKGIVLQAIRHGDKKYILKVFTASHGLITAITTAGKSAASKVKPGYLLPLSLLDMNLVVKQNKEIHQLTEASCYFVSTGFAGNIGKLTIAQFLNELLIKCLKEQGPNKDLFLFLESTIMFLNDSEKDYLNLHLYFMRELAVYLGFEPQNNFDQHDVYFDCREGRFHSIPLPFPLGLSQNDSRVFSHFLNLDVLRSPLKRENRQMLLEILLAYYSLHIPGFNELKSVEVLKTVLN